MSPTRRTRHRPGGAGEFGEERNGGVVAFGRLASGGYGCDIRAAPTPPRHQDAVPLHVGGRELAPLGQFAPKPDAGGRTRTNVSRVTARQAYVGKPPGGRFVSR
ncbi:hypothetical protein [Streptomyces niveiscabiei]|uniref:Uncharacterized protein n=1 Tax=Streptomyces niveiscabiei TaxID=164115 RepID=A0ABW9HYP7_9ACTN